MQYNQSLSWEFLIFISKKCRTLVINLLHYWNFRCIEYNSCISKHLANTNKIPSMAKYLFPSAGNKENYSNVLIIFEIIV